MNSENYKHCVKKSDKKCKEKRRTTKCPCDYLKNDNLYYIPESFVTTGFGCVETKPVNNVPTGGSNPTEGIITSTLITQYTERKPLQSIANNQTFSFNTILNKTNNNFPAGNYLIGLAVNVNPGIINSINSTLIINNQTITLSSAVNANGLYTFPFTALLPILPSNTSNITTNITVTTLAISEISYVFELFQIS
jgi:hypothetical protein